MSYVARRRSVNIIVYFHLLLGNNYLQKTVRPKEFNLLVN